MKNILLFLCLAGCVASANAQTIGLKVGPNATTTNATYSPGFGFSGGIFYDQAVYKKLGLATGVYFTQLRAAGLPFFCLLCLDCPCPDRIDNRFDILEIPLDLTLDLTMQPEKKLRFYLTSGYSFGQLIGEKEIIYDEGAKAEEELISLQGLVKQLHFFKLGLEGKYLVSDKINLGMGAQYKYTRIYDQVYGDFNNWNWFVKTGLRL